MKPNTELVKNILILNSRDTVSKEIAALNILDILQQHHPGAEFTNIQQSALDLGIIDGLVPLVSGNNSRSLRSLSLILLRFMAFQNYDTNIIITKNEALFEAMHQTFIDPLDQYFIPLLTMSLIQTMAANFAAHPALLPFVTHAINILNSPSWSNAIKNSAVKFIGNLCDNELSSQYLIEHRMETILTEAFNNKQNQLWSLSVIGSIACLSRGKSKVLESICDKKIVEEFLEALRASLNRQDYPTGSGGYPTAWKIMLRIRYLCANKHCAILFYEAGLLNSIRNCFESEQKTQQLIKMSLEALWQLNDTLM